MDAIGVRCDDGTVLHADRHAGGGRGVVILLHAMMVDRRSVDRPAGAGLASTLARAGFEVWNTDFRGHGLSGSLGPWTYDDLVMQDVPALVAAARRAGNGPVWVVGQSLGGHVSLASIAAGACAPDGLVMLSGNVWRPSDDPHPGRRMARHASVAWMLGVSRVAGRFPSRRLGVGPADEALPYVEDLARFWREDRWASRDGVDWGARLPGVTIPVLSVIGRGDRLLGHHVGARSFVSRVPGHRFALVGRGDLGLRHDPDHIGLGADRRCRAVWEWIGRWVAATSVR